uniref:Uncharacterized protein n=1 Tax=Ciona intestinalis TaxID=7719 RepID=H2XMY7_CIOIN
MTQNLLEIFILVLVIRAFHNRIYQL